MPWDFGSWSLPFTDLGVHVCLLRHEATELGAEASQCAGARSTTVRDAGGRGTQLLWCTACAAVLDTTAGKSLSPSPSFPITMQIHCKLADSSTISLLLANSTACFVRHGQEPHGLEPWTLPPAKKGFIHMGRAVQCPVNSWENAESEKLCRCRPQGCRQLTKKLIVCDKHA